MAGSDPGLSMSIFPETAVQGGEKDVAVLVSISTPQGSERTPSDICCVIDVSWSMSAFAAGDSKESGGLCLLDVARHAVKTIIRTLGPEDRLSLVSFWKEGRIELPLTKMDAEGQDAAERSVTSLAFGGGTAMWQGLYRGLDSLREGREGNTDRFSHLILLTDGMATDCDEVMKYLNGYVESWQTLPCSLSTFGFGYEIDSKLLVEVADFGAGSYAFIPDAGFVGTCFVNAISNLLVVMAKDVQLVLKADASAGAKVKEIIGGWGCVPQPNGSILVKLGALQFGQTRDIIALMDMPDPGSAAEHFLSASLSASLRDGPLPQPLVAVGPLPAPAGAPEELTKVQHHKCRSSFVDTVSKAALKAYPASYGDDEMPNLPVFRGCEDLDKACIEMVKDAQGMLKKLATEVQAQPAAQERPVAALLEDLVGQTMEALSCLDYYRKWGQHYLPSIASAHKLQQCNNFKDPGVQHYGGELFNRIRDDADDTFNTLPPPQPTKGKYRYIISGWKNGKMERGRIILNPDYSGAPEATSSSVYYATGGGEERAQVNMADFNDRFSGCIDGAALVHLADGRRIQVAALRKGDIVRAGLGQALAGVECVVRCRCPGGRAELVELPSGVRLTPYHPVWVDDAWQFPADLAEVAEVECPEVYSFVLSGAPALMVDSVPCIALGHGLQEGAAQHDFFGTDRVLQELSRCPGFSSGFIDLPAEAFLRDPDTRRVSGICELLDTATSVAAAPPSRVVAVAA